MDHSLIPLLPGYIVFTSAGKKESLIFLLCKLPLTILCLMLTGKKRFKLSILESNNQLLFYWKEFGSDTSYVNRKAQGFEQVAFYYMLKKYGFVTTNSIQYVLGLNIPEIINELKQLVYEKFVIISQVQEPENSKLIKAKKKEETLRRSLKRYQEKIDEIIYENNKNRKNIILYGIQIESDRKRLSPKKAQVLMLNNMENKKTIYSQNRTIKTLKEKVSLKK